MANSPKYRKDKSSAPVVAAPIRAESLAAESVEAESVEADCPSGRLRWGGMRSLLRRLPADNSGSSLIELALLAPVLLLLFIGTVDFGRAWYIHTETLCAAEAGALYGQQNSVDTVGMKAAALLDAPDLAKANTMTATASYGVECSDGSSAVSGSTDTAALNCPTNTSAVSYVEVDTTANYSTILRYPSMPSTLTMSDSVRMRTSN